MTGGVVVGAAPPGGRHPALDGPNGRTQRAGWKNGRNGPARNAPPRPRTWADAGAGRSEQAETF